METPSKIDYTEFRRLRKRVKRLEKRLERLEYPGRPKGGGHAPITPDMVDPSVIDGALRATDTLESFNIKPFYGNIVGYGPHTTGKS